MNNPAYIKVVIKVLNATKSDIRWEHLCYLDKNLYNKYLVDNKITSNDMNGVLSRWCKEDFCLDLSMSTKADLQLLKEVVKDFYRRAHPDIYLDAKSDSQGWMRVWVTHKMKEELKIYGKQCV